MKKNDFINIGKRQPRLDAAQKVTGKAKFTDDYSPAGMLYGKILRSPYPKAKILNIDTSKAAKVKGVKAIVTYEDTAGIMLGPEQNLLCKDEVKHFGEEIAAVAAVDEDTAIEALELIKVEFEPQMPILSIDEALRKGAPPIHNFMDDNIADEVKINFDDCEKEFAEADYIREDEYTTEATHNAFAEHHSVIADFTHSGKLQIWLPVQTAPLIQKRMSEKLGINESDVRVLNLNTGGAFSGRGVARAHHYLAALLSKKSSKPVKIHCTPEEEFLVCRSGGKNKFRFKTAVMKDGTIKAVEAEALYDCGAYIETQFTMARFVGLGLQMLYKMNAFKYNAKIVYTNNIPYLFHHGGGFVPARFAFGTHLDLVAEDIGIDPAEIRLKNAVSKGYRTLSKNYYASCGLKECIKKVLKKSSWKRKRGKLPPFRGIGIGCGVMNSGGKGVFDHDTSAAFIKIGEDGKVSLFTGLPDMGQGSHTVLAMIAAETLGIKIEDITVVSGDSDVTPFDIGAFSQRGTLTTGNAVKNAALDAKRQLLKTAAKNFNVKASSIVFRNRKVYPRGEEEKALPFEEIVFDTLHSSEGRYVMGRGFFNPPTQSVDPITFEGNNCLAYSFGAQVAEVEVNPETGQVKVLRVTAAHDVGRALNPLAIEGQIDGQVFSGMSQTLFEECKFDYGQILNPSLLNYKLPRPFEIPEVEHIIVETNDPYGPFGAKEVGEGPIVCVAQAIANAVNNAIGYPIKSLPITPEKVLEAIRKKMT
ncbi:MAG: aldehyde oxidase [Candidatus Schekmanbacteria bacterium]|nr:MAG: aldehyde oxidase [Candidatus Schekmanbacteria bacterium]